ncbi:MAG: S4 domain-containing protein YaaA [Clostridia bacterium]
MSKAVAIQTEYIPLGQFLKLAGVIDTGGMAKAFLAEVDIMVNGESENRRGRKLYPDDTVVIDGFGEFQVTRR